MSERAENLVGRALAYRLFAEFFRDGLTEAVRSSFEVIEELAPVTPAVCDTEAWAERHYNVMGLNVIGNAGWYLDNEGLVGSFASDTAALVRNRFMNSESVLEPADHISSELTVLAHMCELQAIGLDTAEDQIQFSDGHFLWWVLPFIFTVEKADRELYGAAASLLLNVVMDHRAELGRRNVNGAEVPLGPIGSVLDIKDAGIREIAQYLTSTARSGIVLTRGRIEELAREVGVPRGFGERREMVANLLRSSVEHACVPQALAAIDAECKSWHARYEKLRRFRIEAVDLVAAEWKRRIELTSRTLGRLSESAVSLN